jgi:hypothetical protein
MALNTAKYDQIRPMNISPNGKIARLPHLIRQELHRRLRDGEKGRRIVLWLNSIPEVRQVVAAEFGGRPVNENNLSQWKKRSHRLWLLQQAALSESNQLMAQSRQLAQAGEGATTDHLASFVATEYALARNMLGDDQDERAQWKLLRSFCYDVVGLRRGDHSAERLRLQRQFLALRPPNLPSPDPYEPHEPHES